MAKRPITAKQARIDRAYIVFLLWQCEACLVALARARGESDAARRRYTIEERPGFVGNQQAFSDFQSALTFAGNISKMLWPRFLRPSERRRALARGRRLRRLLGIKQRDRVLFNSPTIRNNFEHLDTRVDDWAQRTGIGALGLHALASDKRFKGVDKTDRFTRYDPDKDALLMLKDRISLTKLEASVKRVWGRSASVFRGIRRYLTQLESQPGSK